MRIRKIAFIVTVTSLSALRGTGVRAMSVGLDDTVEQIGDHQGMSGAPLQGGHSAAYISDEGMLMPLTTTQKPEPPKCNRPYDGDQHGGGKDKPEDYSFEYSVNDFYTGDVKGQQEKKEGDKVTGHYWLKEPDGTIRLVQYTAGKDIGFKAVVTKSGTPHPPPYYPMFAPHYQDAYQVRESLDNY